ncbi:MAG: LamG-like jellyroll fold domain-containing protein [Mycobacteriales bacterium]
MIARVLAVATVLAGAAAVSALPASPSRASDPVAPGHRIEVTALRTENRQVFQNPDGTYTSDSTPTPRWVRRGNGWADVDTSLRAGTDGRVTPKAAPLDISFSGGGDTTLATLGDHGRSLTMSWDAKLPAPVLDGSSARYPDVLPGVDLQVTATTTGFSEVLVVKSAQAARNPALSSVHFGVSGHGVAVRGDGAGGATAVAGDGAEVFHSPVPELWDAAAGDAVHTFDTATAATGHPSTAGGVRRAMRTDVAADGLTVHPDPAVLAGSGVHFPLYLDPEWAGGKLGLTYVDKGYPSQPYWNKGDGIASGTYNSGSNVKRTFFRMDTSNVASKHILKATFRIKETWSYSCTAARVDLWLTGGISSTTTWSKQPAFTQDLGNLTVAKGWSSTSCPAGEIEFDVSPTVTSMAAQSAANVTLALRAYSETSDSGWKRWDPSPHLVIDYNTVPNAPTGIGTLPGTPCVSGTTDRPYVNTSSPLLYANIYDPDGANGSVRAEFAMRHWDTTSSSWQAFGSTIVTDYVSTTTPTTLRVTSPSLRDGESYSWQVRAYDGIDGSAWSSWCEFRVDTSVPLQLPQVSSTDYPAGTTFADAHGSPGLPGAFTLSATNMTGITSFRYALNDVNVAHAAAVDAAGATATALISPPHDQQNTLYVWPVDQAGNVGPFYATYDFFVAFASGPAGYWKLDEGSGTVLADTASHPLTTGGGMSWTAAGRSGAALHDDGATGYATSTGPVVHTDRSFSVSAWVRLTGTGHIATVATQTGTWQTGFQLYYSTSYNRWVFNRYDTDTTGSGLVRAISDAQPKVNAWTHLVGVYDGVARKISLYVDGVLQAITATVPSPWDATGPVELGREKHDGTYTDYFAGDIDEVRIYDRVLLDQPGCDPVELDNLPQCKDGIHGLATRPGTPQLAWTFDEGTGTTSADQSGNGRTATLAGGAAWDDDQQVGSALALNGTTAYATSSGPALRTDGSFTVAAWVRIGAADSSTLPTVNETVIGQDSTSNSPFYLGYRLFTENGVQVAHWSFSLTSADTTGSKTWWHAASDPAHAPQAGTWTHLVGVYDATSHEARLYVGGELVDRVVGVQAWNSTGKTTAGRAWWNAGGTDFVNGAIDDVRAYTGTLTDGEIWNLSSR